MGQVFNELWKRLLPDMLHTLNVHRGFGSMKLMEDDFTSAAKRGDYCFTLEITDGEVSNNPGSSVAKNLAEVFLTDADASAFADGKYIVIRLDKTFTLYLSAMKE